MKMSIQIERKNQFASPECRLNLKLYLTGEPNVDFVLAEMKKGIMGAWANFVEREKKKAGGKADSWKS